MGQWRSKKTSYLLAFCEQSIPRFARNDARRGFFNKLLKVLSWFLVVGGLTLRVDNPLLGFFSKEDPSLKTLRQFQDLEWHWVIGNLLLIFLLFTNWFYPRIMPAIGDGQPSKVTIQFAGASPIDGLPQTDGWLVDETDSGYYLVRAQTDHQAIFLARPIVSVVYFGGRGTYEKSPPNVSRK